jgi:hypothetical protein
MSTLAVTIRVPRRRAGRARVARPSTPESYVPGADYIPSGTADMWRSAKPQYRR